MTSGKASVGRFGALLFALLGLGTIAQATPITNFGPDLEMTPQRIASHTRNVAAAVAPAAASAGEKVNSANVNGPSLCELTSTCRTTLKVPEPQSLVLLGTGLLSMAGVIRRKLLQ